MPSQQHASQQGTEFCPPVTGGGEVGEEEQAVRGRRRGRRGPEARQWEGEGDRCGAAQGLHPRPRAPRPGHRQPQPSRAGMPLTIIEP
jgi:hypothetical protein